MSSPHPRDPVYQRLADRLVAMIRMRSLVPGDRVPSVRAFSRQHRVSVPTALHAYVTLEARGVIEARPKSGFFVRAHQADAMSAPAVLRSKPRVTDLSGLDPLDSILSDQADPSLVPLGAAIPDPTLLATSKLSRTMAVLARRKGDVALAYDMAPGNAIMRREIARRSLEWGGALSPDDIIITNGCTEAVALALRAVCRPGDTVVVESPTYFGLARTLRDFGLRALPVPVDSTTGLDLDLFEQALKRTRVAACVLIPNFHNPVGCLVPDDRKREIARLARQYDVAVIEDDIYGDLPHDGARPRCIKADDDEGVVMLCGSFSKTLAPGCRVGFIAPGRWHARVMALKQAQSLANASLPVMAVAEFVRHGGYDRYLRTFRRALRDQVARMREAVAEFFPADTKISRPAGGFVLWCELPPGSDALTLFHSARAARISIAPGPLFGPDRGFDRCIRLNCGYTSSPRTLAAVRTLGKQAGKQAGG